MTGRPPATDRLVDAYLHDLERALGTIEMDERREVVDSVREHIDTALEERGGTPAVGDVADVLRELGPVEDIVRNADTGSRSQHVATGDENGANDPRRAAAARYLLAALIVGAAVTASLAIVRIPPLFSPEGGDPVAVTQLVWVSGVLAVAALIIKRNTPT